MTYSAKFSILKNVVKSLFNLSKDVNNFDLDSITNIQINSKLIYTIKELDRFRQITQWQGNEIHPVFPYALLTHLHFSLVNDKNFPFSPYGLIHKKEHIECYAPLPSGAWPIHCKVKSLRKVERGYEIDIVSEITINNKVIWKSTTTAFKKTTTAVQEKKHAPISIESDISWNIPRNNGRLYGMISNNIDPIHLSMPTAKIMGHKQAIMHGMWTCARGVSQYNDIKYPFSLKVIFISPLYIPAKVLYKKSSNGFGVYSNEGTQVHLLAEFIHGVSLDSCGENLSQRCIDPKHIWTKIYQHHISS